MSNTIEGGIDIDFFEVLTLTLMGQYQILELLTLKLTLTLFNNH